MHACFWPLNMDSHECTNTSRRLKISLSLVLVPLTLPRSVPLRSAVQAGALCCSWMCIINTVRANSAESPIISRGKLYVNAPLMASFVNGIVVQARGIEPWPESAIRSARAYAAWPSFNAARALIVSCIAFSYRAHVRARAHTRAQRRLLEKSREISLGLILSFSAAARMRSTMRVIQWLRVSGLDRQDYFLSPASFFFNIVITVKHACFCEVAEFPRCEPSECEFRDEGFRSCWAAWF